MNIQRGPIVDGRPQFNETHIAPAAPLMAKSHLFRSLAPSSSPSSILYRIKQIIAKILRYFIPEKPALLHGRLAAVLSNSTLRGEVSMGNLIDHYKQFLSDNRSVPRGLLNCFEQLKKDETQLERLYFQLEKANTDKKRDAAKLKKQQFITENSAKITSMKNGATRLMMLHRSKGLDGSLDGDLFCLIQKENDAYTLRLIGSGPAMKHLQQGSIPLAGKEKVLRELVFENISPTELCANDWLNTFVTRWGERQGIDPALISLDDQAEESTSTSEEGEDKTLQKLNIPFKQKEIESLNELTSQSEQASKIFWNILHVFPTSKQRNSSVGKKQKRIKLRAELLSLFDLFKLHRFQLNPGAPAYHEIKKAFEAASNQVLHAYKKGYINDNDLQKMQAELAIIDRSLQKATMPSPPIIPAKQRLPKTFISLDGLHPAAGHDVKLSSTSLQKESFVPLKVEELEISTAIDFRPTQPTKEEFLTQLRELFTSWQNKPEERIKIKQELFQLFTHTRMDLFEKENPSDPTNPLSEEKPMVFGIFGPMPFYSKTLSDTKTDSFWWQFSDEEAQEMIDSIHVITDTLTQDEQFRRSCSQYDLEGLLKMSMAVLTLDAMHAKIKREREFSGFETDEHGPSLRSILLDYKLGAHNSNGSWSLARSFIQFTDPFRQLCLDIEQVENLKPFEASENINKQKIYFNRLTETSQNHGTWGTSSMPGHTLRHFFMPSRTNYWMRPIPNPFLISMLRNAASQIARTNRQRTTLYDNSTYEIMGNQTPEAFQSVPEYLFPLFKEEVNNRIEYRNNDDPYIQQQEPQTVNLEPLLKSIPVEFSQEEQRRLLHVLLFHKPHRELLAFMHEMPHLLRNAEVRNYVDALFFGTELPETLKNKTVAALIPQQLEEEIDREENLLTAALENQAEDTELLESHVDKLLFLYEMYEKLRHIYPTLDLSTEAFQSHAEPIAKLLQLAIDNEDLRGTLGYAARVHLRMLIGGEEIAPKNLSQVLTSFALAKGAYVNPMNVDPIFEEELMRRWKKIASQLKNEEKDFTPLLNTFCSARGLPLDGSLWQAQDPLVFLNGQYEVNLENLSIKSLRENGNLASIPNAILANPQVHQVFKGVDFRSAQVNSQIIDGQKVHTFMDSSEIPCQIIEGEKSVALLKKIEGKWLQSIPPTFFAPPIKKENSTTTSAFKKEIHNFFRKEEEIPTLSFLSRYDAFIDPLEMNRIVCLNTDGTIALELHLKETDKGFLVEEVDDHRNPHRLEEGYQVVHAHDLKTKHLDFLTDFERKEQILLWSQKNALKKVEFLRYGLSFTLDKGRLVCTHKDFQGYFIQQSASLEDKKGFKHALVLDHPDPNKPRKLLLPNIEAISLKTKEEQPHATGFAKLVLFLQRLISLLQGHVPALSLSYQSKLKGKKATLAYTSFDLRPFTHEVCEKKTNWIPDALQLIQHALLDQNYAFAWKLVQRLHMTSDTLDQKALNQLMVFLSKTTLTVPEAAIKLKLCFEIKSLIAKKQQLNATLENTFDENIFALAKTVIAHGRKIPIELQLNDSERRAIAKIAQKLDEDYYKIHLKPYFLEEGQEFDPSALNEIDIEISDEQPIPSIQERIELLETTVSPETLLQEEDLKHPLVLLPKGKEEALLFSEKDVEALFTPSTRSLPDLQLKVGDQLSTCETPALNELQQAVDQYRQEEANRPCYMLKAKRSEIKRFLKKQLIPKRDKFTEDVYKHKKAIEKALRTSTDIQEQLTIFSQSKQTASWNEFHKAFVQNRLPELQANQRLPSTLSLEELTQLLFNYYDALSRKSAAENCIQLIETMLTKKEEEWPEFAHALHQLLTLQRRYDAQADPRLLTFEAQQFINFKPLEGGLDQIDLLSTVLGDPYAMVLAPTGSGKTTVFSLLRSLMKANGKNLVVQKVLPHLFQQTYDKIHEVGSDLYGLGIYPLRFNLKMRLVATEISRQGDEGVTKEVSIFKKMYLQLLETIENRGCVLTDYKSLPLLEEKFWKISQEILERKQQGLKPTDIQNQHFDYLKKILRLLETKADENMDEFDQPNRPIQKIQVDLGGGLPFNPDQIAHALEVYNLLLEDQTLGLQKNIQGDLTEEMRMDSIARAAQNMAEQIAPGNARLLDYFLGKNEDILEEMEDCDPALRDKVAFCKDQFTIYLPLSLRGKQGSRSTRAKMANARCLAIMENLTTLNGALPSSKRMPSYKITCKKALQSTI